MKKLIMYENENENNSNRQGKQLIETKGELYLGLKKQTNQEKMQRVIIECIKKYICKK